SGTTSTLAVVSGKYEAHNGSAEEQVLVFSRERDTYSDTTTDKSRYDAEGRPSGGTLYDHSESDLQECGFVWSRNQVQGSPTRTALQVMGSLSSHTATTDLAFTSAGKANGSLNASAKSLQGTITNVILEGEKDLYYGDGSPMGWAYFDDSYYSKDQTGWTES